MECPHCGSGDTNVIDSRPSKDAIRRRRTCSACEHRFTTYERVAELEPAVVKRDERREPFQHSKVHAGIRLAVAKRPLPEGEIDRIVESVRTRAVQTGRAEIASRTIGEWVWEELKALDRVAAFRFAAVFRRPQDFDALRRELSAAELAAPAVEASAAKQPRLPGIAGGGAAARSSGEGAPPAGATPESATPPPDEERVQAEPSAVD